MKLNEVKWYWERYQDYSPHHQKTLCIKSKSLEKNNYKWCFAMYELCYSDMWSNKTKIDVIT